MNIFETYQDKIKNLILDINKQGKIEISDNLDSIGVDLPVNLRLIFQQTLLWFYLK